MNKPRIFSGVQPSGNLHIGNYLGAITQFVELQKNYDCIYCVVDYHAITVKQDPKVLEKNIIEIAKIFIASGVDPEKSIIFQQSSVSAHTELAWILNCVARMSDLKKMTQFKDKAGEDQENVSVGLFAYPSLMAADILLYQTAAVPVGDDQSQHVELARTLARRFNQQFAVFEQGRGRQAFKEPGLIIKKETARIMGLDDPAKKMSKSVKSEYNRIELLEDPVKAMKKIMRAETDSGRDIKYNLKGKPGVSNLLTVYSILGEKSIKELEKLYAGKGYGDLKKDLAQVVKEFLVAFQIKYKKISDSDVRRILDQGADKARPIAEATLKEVKKRIGVN